MAEQDVKDWLSDSLANASTKREVDSLYGEKIQRKVYKLDERPATIGEMVKRASSDAQKRKRDQQKRRSGKVKKLPLSAFKIKDGVQYSDVISLNILWLQYAQEQIRDLMIPSGVKDLNFRGNDALLDKVTKLDLHGCILQVYHSRSKCQIGIEGIVIQDLANCFKIVCKSDETQSNQDADNMMVQDLNQSTTQAVKQRDQNSVKTIGKQHSIFKLQLGVHLADGSTKDLKFLLFGSQLTGRPSERLSKKLAAPSSLNL
ncbi:hypothetical protein MP228_008631 [Amoeboaphelidium protococcarum]|nr:hypothetical protein MP228_008631 [Amoeboaphelidium protococcarum]